MSRKPFTPEEIEILRTNPYTEHVNQTMIRFTADFKQTFWILRQQNKSIAEIFIELGYDPKIFGEIRMRHTANRIRKEALSERGIHSSFGPRENREDIENMTNLSNGKKVEVLEGEVRYLRQQISFIKKILEAERRRK